MADIGWVFDRYKDRIYRLALGIARNEKDAEDITQNTFLKILNNYETFKKASRLSTWIYRIAYNEALMLLRKKRKESALSDSLTRESADLFIHWPSIPDKAVLDKELRQRLDSAVTRLPIKYRMALLLRNAEDLPIKDAAGILGIKVNSMKTRLHRASMLIAGEMSDYYRDRPGEEGKPPAACPRHTAFLYNYAGDTLNKRRRLAFERHIATCADCASFLRSYVNAIRITKALQCRDIPPALKDKLESFLIKK